MKLLRACTVFLLISTPLLAEEALDPVKISEAFGHIIGSGLDNAPGFSFDVEGIIRGLRLAVDGKPSPMSDEELERALTQINEQAKAIIASDNLDQADIFLQTNAKESHVVSLEAGKLQYKVTKMGHGPKVVENATCKVKYSGRYADGELFTSSEDRVVEFNLSQSIPGFSKGIAGMQEGEKRLLYIHPELGYGTTDGLHPNALLIFDVELVDAGGDPLACIGED